MWATLCENWQGFKLTMTTKTLIGWFCMGKQPVLAYIPKYLIVSPHCFCNDICLLHGLHSTRNHVIWNGGWPAVKVLWWKVGFTPRAIWRVPQTRQFSSSGVLSTSGCCPYKLPGPGPTFNSHYKNTPIWGLSWPPLQNCPTSNSAALSNFHHHTLKLQPLPSSVSLN